MTGTRNSDTQLLEIVGRYAFVYPIFCDVSEYQPALITIHNLKQAIKEAAKNKTPLAPINAAEEQKFLERLDSAYLSASVFNTYITIRPIRHKNKNYYELWNGFNDLLILLQKYETHKKLKVMFQVIHNLPLEDYEEAQRNFQGFINEYGMR